MLIKILGVVFFTIISSTSLADISVYDRQYGTKRIVVSGEITPSDYNTLIAKVKEISSRGKLDPVIELNSGGGDLMTSMRIGRYLRESKTFMGAMVYPEKVCASACVFILAGSRLKTPWEGSKIIIHRPYVNNDSLVDANQQKQRYQKIEKIVKDYLNEMNVSTQLYDDMFRINSDSGKHLSKDELISYGLQGLDPFEKEAQEAKRAKELGISKTELYKRDARVDTVCSDFMRQCLEAASSNLDEKSKLEACGPVSRCREEVLHGKR